MRQNAHMPRSVDKDARRRAVANALFRIVAREGLSAVSMRTVAHEAGLSLGAVQRYFRSKEEMLRFALDQAVATARERMSRIAIGPERLSFAEGLRQALLTFLPEDEQRLAEARIWVAFYAEAAVHPAFAQVLHELDTEARDNLRRLLAYARSTGELAPDQDPHAAAELLLALFDGLLWMAVRQLPGTPPEPQYAARTAIEAAVTALTARG